MTIRTVAVLPLLLFVADAAASAQPVPPQRPRSTPFQNLFYPRSQAVPNFGAGGGGNFGPLQPGLNNQFGPRAFGQQGLLVAGADGTVTPYLVIPMQSQPAVFNNLGHWYSNYYGHWYPNGVRSGLGVLANSGGGGVVGGVGGFGGGIGGIGMPGGVGGIGAPGGQFAPGRLGGGVAAPIFGVGGGFRR
jgi:hypothetical protein